MLFLGIKQVTLSDGTTPRISEADLEVSRHRISVYLSTHTAYELLPESGKVWMLHPHNSFQFNHLNKRKFQSHVC